jgi:hypothetical protein
VELSRYKPYYRGDVVGAALSTPPRELCPLTPRDERNKALAYLAVFVFAIVFFLWVLWP